MLKYNILIIVFCVLYLKTDFIRNILNLQITIVDLSIKIFLQIILFVLVYKT